MKTEVHCSVVQVDSYRKQKVNNMSFWQENYAFIKDVYDTKSARLLELMDKTEKAIAEVTDEKKLYTSAEFKKVKETFTVGQPTSSRRHEMAKKFPSDY